jgi:hypothetical protein
MCRMGPSGPKGPVKYFLWQWSLDGWKTKIGCCREESSSCLRPAHLPDKPQSPLADPCFLSPADAGMPPRRRLAKSLPERQALPIDERLPSTLVNQVYNRFLILVLDARCFVPPHVAWKLTSSSVHARNRTRYKLFRWSGLTSGLLVRLYHSFFPPIFHYQTWANLAFFLPRDLTIDRSKFHDRRTARAEI